MSTHLKALALKNYKGIGSAIQKIGPFEKFNFFVGANNAGKSAVLSFIYKYLVESTKYNKVSYHRTESDLPQFDVLERHVSAVATGGNGDIEAAIGIPRAVVLQTFKNGANPSLQPDYVRQRITQLDSQISRVVDLMCDQDGFSWVKCSFKHDEKPALLDGIDLNAAISAMMPEEWRTVWNLLTNQTGGSAERDWIPETVARVLQLQNFSFFKPVLIPAIRKIGPSAEGLEDHSGLGLIDRLAQLQNPGFDKLRDKVVFDKINNFFRDVIGDPNAQLEIPYERKYILVHTRRGTFPLESLGTGIHEVIIIAAFCTLNDGRIVCIEEPEIHLHPLLQRKLIQYLDKNTTVNIL